VPRYHLSITDGNETLDNPKGFELPGDAAARNEALLLAQQLKDGRLFPDRDWDGWFVSIVNQDGEEIERVPIDLVQGFQSLP
jgi:hypothetical protein